MTVSCPFQPWVKSMTMVEWKVHCSRVVTLNFALLGIALSLIAIARCDFFQSIVELHPSTCTDNSCEDSQIQRTVSWGLFRYNGSVLGGEDFGTGLDGSTCQTYEGSIFNNQLARAQSFSIVAPISSLIGCVISMVDVCNIQAYWIWMMMGAWFMACLAQSFSFVALRNIEFCRGIDGYEECQISTGAVAAILAVLCDLMAIMFVGIMARNQLKSHSNIVSP